MLAEPSVTTTPTTNQSQSSIRRIVITGELKSMTRSEGWLFEDIRAAIIRCVFCCSCSGGETARARHDAARRRRQVGRATARRDRRCRSDGGGDDDDDELEAAQGARARDSRTVGAGAARAARMIKTNRTGCSQQSHLFIPLENSPERSTNSSGSGVRW
jgi:hypothetical protein